MKVAGHHRHSTTTSGWSNSTGWASETKIWRTVPALGAMIGFITFIASMISKVSPFLTGWPVAMNGFAPGSGERKAVPTIGDLIALAGAAGSGAAASGAATGAAAAGAAWAGAGAAATGAASRLTLILRS